MLQSSEKMTMLDQQNPQMMKRSLMLRTRKMKRSLKNRLTATRFFEARPAFPVFWFVITFVTDFTNNQSLLCCIVTLSAQNVHILEIQVIPIRVLLQLLERFVDYVFVTPQERLAEFSASGSLGFMTQFLRWAVG
jgi:hypothetical protein